MSAAIEMNVVGPWIVGFAMLVLLVILCLGSKGPDKGSRGGGKMI